MIERDNRESVLMWTETEAQCSNEIVRRMAT